VTTTSASESPEDKSSVVAVTETYYDSDDADRFYFHIWGGEDIHIGLYADGDSVFDASRKTVARMADKLTGVSEKTKVLDLGAGYGGSGRYLAKRFGCHVNCLNLSETQNDRNRKLNKEQELSDLVDVVHANFEKIPSEDNAYDVVWSQDAFLHSGQRRKVLEEVRRVLRPGGQLIFTDPMQSDDCPSGVLQPVLDRIHLETLGSVKFYREVTKELGFSEVSVESLLPQLVKHYATVRGQLQVRHEDMVKVVSKEYVNRMIHGLSHWVDAGEKGYLNWGILHFKLDK